MNHFSAWIGHNGASAVAAYFLVYNFLLLVNLDRWRPVVRIIGVLFCGFATLSGVLSPGDYGIPVRGVWLIAAGALFGGVVAYRKIQRMKVEDPRAGS